MTDDLPLGVFGHHPDSGIDFSVEVEALIGTGYEVCVGIASQWPFWARLGRAVTHGRKTDWEGQSHLQTILIALEEAVTKRDYNAVVALSSQDLSLKNAGILDPDELLQQVRKLAEALRAMESWLTAALNCPAWSWDADQHEAATIARDEALAVLQSIRR